MGLFSRQPDDEDRARAVPANTPRAITASAQRMRLDDKDEIDRFKQRKSADSWQTDAWEYFDAIGEVKYSGNLIGAVLSRVRLYPGYNVNPDQAPSHVSQAAAHDTVDLPDEFANDCDRVLQRLQTANGGISGILNRAGINIWVAGECYLVQTPEKPGSGIPERWDIKSVDELIVNPNASNSGNVLGQAKSLLSIKSTRNARLTKADELPATAFAGRIWRSHPRYSDEADSSLRAVRDLCDELLLLNRSARATIRSRLNAGAMYLPDGLSLAADADEDDQLDPNTAEVMADPPEEEDPFEQELMDAMITPISDEESVAAVVPLIIRGPAELADKIKQFKFERSFDPEMVTRAATILDRIMHGLDIPKDVVSGMANVKYCADERTEALTRTGWTTYDKLALDDEVYTLNPKTGLAEWQPVLAINIFDTFDEPMLSIEKRGHSSLTTANHRWLVQDRDGTYRETTSAAATGYDKIPLAVAAADVPTEAKYSDDLVELVAWLYTEGSFSLDRKPLTQTGYGSQGRRVGGVAQYPNANPQHYSRIRATLTRLYGPESKPLSSSEAGLLGRSASFNGDSPKWYTNHSGFRFNEEVIQSFEHAFEGSRKAVRRDFIYSLTRAQLELFVQVSSWADGCGKAVVGSVFGQKYEERQESFELACHLLGLPIARRSNGNGWYDCRVKVRQTANMVGTWTSHTGKVWCPTTENGTWFARRNGTYYFTGNSNAVQIDETLYKAHVEPLILLICDALTEVYYRPALLAMGHTPETIQKALIWYDPSDILTHPNKAQSANDGYDRRALSGRAWRKAHGYAETDAPTNEELAFRILVERAVPPPQLVTQLFQMFIPTLMQQANANGLGADNAAGPLAPGAQDILEGQPEQPNDNGAPPAQPGANPATQPPAPPTPPTPATPLPVSPNPSVPTSNGMRS